MSYASLVDRVSAGKSQIIALLDRLNLVQGVREGVEGRVGVGVKERSGGVFRGANAQMLGGREN